jgi:hypothetical protein
MATTNPKLFNWTNVYVSSQSNNLSQSPIMRSEFCDTMISNKTTVRIINFELPFKMSYSLCLELGGKMPLPTKSKDFAATFGENIMSYFPPECKRVFWIPVVKSKNKLDVWIDGSFEKDEKPVDYLPWARGQPNGETVNCHKSSLLSSKLTFAYY